MLDNFFRLAREAAKNPNPSGTAGTLNAVTVATALPFRAVAKLLYSPAGVRFGRIGRDSP